MIPPRKQTLQCINDEGDVILCQRSSAVEVLGIEGARVLDDVSDIYATEWWELKDTHFCVCKPPVYWRRISKRGGGWIEVEEAKV